MKTHTNLISRLLLSCLLLFIVNFSAHAQWPFPTTGAPFIPTTTVDCGSLQNPDSQIWVKVNGNIAGPTPHNKMHPFVVAGATVEVNFNVNKNKNRYTLVSYKVDDQGVRTIFDYQSNLYNNGSPVQGNSNQQKVLVPNNCKWEIYLVKGCLVTSFTAGAPAGAPVTGPAGNPYEASKNGGNNRVLDYAYGNAASGTTCDVCPKISDGNPATLDDGNGILAISPFDKNQVYFRVLEVIDNPTAQTKNLIFMVINTTNTKDAKYASYDYIGDVLFSNILPAHHPRNNTPYQFRYNYQAGPQITGYTIGGAPTGLSYGPKDAFVFDQRNNHNNLNYGTYQSELFMFEVTYGEFTRLSNLGPNSPNKPEICAELSSKHPEPGKTLHPVFCAPIDFSDCRNCPVTTDECFAQNCDYKIELVQINGITDPSTGSYSEYLLAFNVTNLSGASVMKTTFTTTGATATNTGYDDDGNPVTPVTTSFTTTAAANLLTFANPVPAWNTAGTSFTFFYQVPASSIATVNNGTITLQPGSTVTASVMGTNGTTFSYNFVVATDNPNADPSPCLIVPLPVELTSFTGKAVSEGIALNWKTASEKNNDRFEIERSADGRNFEKIGTVKGNGTSNVAHSYSFLDKSATAGINYYRLNQVDFGGTNERSQIIKVSTEKAGNGLGVQLIPNPCHDQNCTVQLKGVDTNAPITVELRDLTGRLIFSQQVAADQTSFQMPRVESGNGIYILSARNGNATTYQKIVIQ